MIKIGVTGLMGAGKSSFAGFLQEWAGIHGSDILPFAYHLKLFSQKTIDCNPWTQDGKKEMLPHGLTTRELLQKVGCGVRSELPDFWVWAWKNEVQNFEAMDFKYVIADDVRFENEAKEMDIIFHIVRPGIEQGDHESEKLEWIKQFKVIEIKNDGALSDLDAKAQVWSEKIKVMGD